MRFIVVLMCSVWFSLDTGLAVGQVDGVRRVVSGMQGHLKAIADKGFLKPSGKLRKAVRQAFMGGAVITMLATAGCSYHLNSVSNAEKYKHGKDISRKGVSWHGHTIKKNDIIPLYDPSYTRNYYYGVDNYNKSESFYDKFNDGKMKAHDYNQVVVIYHDEGRYFIGVALRLDGSKDLVEVKHINIDNTPDKTINVDKVHGAMFTHHADRAQIVEVHPDDLLPVGGMEIHDSNDDVVFYGKIVMPFTSGDMLIYFKALRSNESRAEYQYQELNPGFWALAHVDDLLRPRAWKDWRRKNRILNEIWLWGD